MTLNWDSMESRTHSVRPWACRFDGSRDGSTLSSLIRFGLLIVALLFVGLMVAAHGVRALALLAVLAGIWAITGTRAWKVLVDVLTRVTGSRRAAYASLGFVVVAAFAIFNIYQATR